MEPGIIALICAASFGAIAAIAAFVRHLLLSRDKNLNDEAQRRALAQEVEELENMREQMQSNKRFDAHYKILGANKDDIIYLDSKIEELLHKKMQLIERYSQLSLRESSAIVEGQCSAARKNNCDRLKAEIDEEITFYDNELVALQQRRTSLWDAHGGLQEHLLKQEQARNASLDALYKQHSALLEKIYIRHTENSEHIAIKSISAGTSLFESIVMAPIQFLMSYFNGSSGISFVQANIEAASRDDVARAEDELNGVGPHVHHRVDDSVEDRASLRAFSL